ncbi:FAD-dependent oxidoreductase [Legionella cardiaca]|uniref:FAD-dependent oxidoreductase n=1 Tax=Legionella cardiaca TaxID=1071983 RepID=A0ABY8ASE8_9GAMM|nr:FAD-dependent oxidoreductase [Legionella cardiaca]WED42097.1 FAD-dependent oxidoreductase [Legionella cardiaca]
MNMKIAIIGAGWYGCHLALELRKAGYDVTIYEKNSDILSGVSGNFGIRIHKGPHYQSSPKTRASCQADFERFCTAYPEFVVPHRESIYGLGKTDAFGNPSKVNKEHFITVCEETPDAKPVDLSKSPYQQLDAAMNLDEPSAVIGERLRKGFREKLESAGVNIVTNCTIDNIYSSQNDKCILVDKKGHSISVDYAINATGYQSFFPPDIEKNFPVEMEVVYQPCLALEYQDTKPQEAPFSFIVMDGWYPCIMPCVKDNPFKHQYILTHGAYTILASCKTPEEASKVLSELKDEFVDKEIRARSASEMIRFWPEFEKRFKYQGWKSTVLAKIKTKTEFRSAVTFASDKVIHVIPGKISNVMTVGDEVMALLNDVNCLQEKGVRFMQNGVLDQARSEIATKPAIGEPNTCTLNTYADLTRSDLKKTALTPPTTFFSIKKTLLTKDGSTKKVSLLSTQDPSDSQKTTTVELTENPNASDIYSYAFFNKSKAQAPSDMRMPSCCQ